MHGVVIKKNLAIINKNTVCTKRKAIFFPILTEERCYIYKKICNSTFFVNLPSHAWSIAFNSKHYSLKMGFLKKESHNVVN
jgi:hypothetical protein